MATERLVHEKRREILRLQSRHQVALTLLIQIELTAAWLPGFAVQRAPLPVNRCFSWLNDTRLCSEAAVRIVFMVLLFALPATAAQQVVRLEYAPASSDMACPSADEFKSLVAARLGRDPFSVDAGRVARVSIALRESKLSGTLSILAADGTVEGQRQLPASAHACAALAESLALALAIAVDPQLMMKASAKIEEPTVAPKPVAAAVPPPAAVPAPAEAPVPRSVRALVSGVGAFGLLPALAGGVAVEVGVRRLAFSLGIDGSFMVPQTFQAAGGSIETSSIRGGLRVCGHVQWFGACLHGTGGVLRVAGDGFDNSKRVVLPTATVGPSVEAQLNPVSDLLVRVSVGADLSLIRNGLLVGAEQVWRSGLVSIDAVISVGWIFR